MPELPEVETMVRGIRPHVEGRVIREMRLVPCHCRPIPMFPKGNWLTSRVQGQPIVEVFRRAKRCVLRLDSGEGIVIEPRMTGLMLLSEPPDHEHLRIEWKLGGRGEYRSLWFWDRRGLGTVSLLSKTQLESLCGVGKLGRDALAMQPTDWDDFCGRTSSPVKVALLNQKLVAGIGNLYASEILFLAGISPLKSAKKISKIARQKLAAAVREILEEAIRYEGSTLGDGTYRNALNQAGNYQNAHRVYQRAEESCPRCKKGTIKRIVQVQRSTFYCPQCQR